MKPNSNANANPTFASSSADDERSLPIGVGDMVGDDAAFDPLATASESRRFRGGSIVLVVVIVIACGGLWFMRSLSNVSGAAGAISDIEKSIEGFLSNRDTKGNIKAAQSRGEADVLRVINESYSDKFVPLNSVQRNPFILPGENESKIVTPITGDEPAEVLARARAQRQREIDSASSRLSVKSIIMSNSPLANISGMIVRVGDEIAPEGSEVSFRVMAITPDTVTLVTDDLALGMHVEIPLTMRRDR